MVFALWLSPYEPRGVQLVDISYYDYLELCIICGSEYYLICAIKPNIWDNFNICFYFTFQLKSILVVK